MSGKSSKRRNTTRKSSKSRVNQDLNIGHSNFTIPSESLSQTGSIIEPEDNEKPDHRDSKSLTPKRRKSITKSKRKGTIKKKTTQPGTSDISSSIVPPVNDQTLSLSVSIQPKHTPLGFRPKKHSISHRSIPSPQMVKIDTAIVPIDFAPIIEKPPPQSPKHKRRGGRRRGSTTKKITKEQRVPKKSKAAEPVIFDTNQSEDSDFPMSPIVPVNVNDEIAPPLYRPRAHSFGCTRIDQATQVDIEADISPQSSEILLAPLMMQKDSRAHAVSRGVSHSLMLPIHPIGMDVIMQSRADLLELTHANEQKTQARERHLKEASVVNKEQDLQRVQEEMREKNAERSTNAEQSPWMNKSFQQMSVMFSLTKDDSRENQAALSLMSQPIEEFKQCCLTQALGPPDPSEIKLDDAGNLLAISYTALFDFQFGTIANSDPDVLHIYTWHNLGLKGKAFARKLLFITDAHCSMLTKDTNIIRSILNYLFIWLGEFPLDFTNEEIATPLLRVTERIVFSSQDDQSLRHNCYRLHLFIESLLKGSECPFSFTPPLREPEILFSQCTLSTAPPSLLVANFSFVEANLIRHITASEFVHLNWDSPEKDRAAPYMNVLVCHTNSVINFIAESITNRVRKVDFWIDCMAEADRQNEVQLLFEISGALAKPKVRHNRAFWKDLSKQTMRQFKALNAIADPVPSMIKAVKKRMFEKVVTIVPYIALFTSELVFRNNDPSIPSEALLPNGKLGINIEKHQGDMFAIQAICNEWCLDLQFGNIDPMIIKEIVGLSRNQVHVADDVYGDRFVAYLTTRHIKM